MNEFPMSAAGWQAGLTLTDYVDQMERHQDATRRRLARLELPAQARSAFAALPAVRHALVITEAWCGDSMINVPILAGLVAAAPRVDLRIFPRSRSPELEAYYQARDITHIPVFSFLDADFRILATWVERPRLASERLAAWYAVRPEVVAIRNDASLDADTRRARLRPLTSGLLDEMEGWYDHEGVQQATIDELLALLQR